jgi:hypothetical protein
MSDEICIPPRRGIPRLGLTRRDSTQYLVKVRCSRGAARQTRDLGWRDPRCPSSPWRSERVWRDDTDHADGIATEMRPQNNPEAVRSPCSAVPLRRAAGGPSWSRRSLRVIKFTIDIHPIHQAGRGDSCRAPQQFLSCGVPRCSWFVWRWGCEWSKRESGGLHLCLVSSTWRRKWSLEGLGSTPARALLPKREAQKKSPRGKWVLLMFGQCQRLGADGQSSGHTLYPVVGALPWGL